MSRNAGSVICLVLTLVVSGSAVAAEGFETMAQPEEAVAECVAPRPPRDLAKTAYIRNGYRAILRILAARHWQEAGDCACVIQDIPWDEVVAQGAEFVTGDDPLRPFDTSELRLMADALEADRAAACESQ